MAHHRIDSNVLAILLNATSVTIIEEVKREKNNGTLTDSDPVGAMKFTVAVVLVYGIGVIGLLGITARRNRRVEMMDKEVNKYIKSLHREKPVKRKRKRQSSIYRLISSLHLSDKGSNDEISAAEHFELSKLQRHKAHSWTSGIEHAVQLPPKSKQSDKRLKQASRTVTVGLLTKIEESQLEEVSLGNDEAPTHTLGNSSPSLFLPVDSDKRQNEGNTPLMSNLLVEDNSSHPEDTESDMIAVTLVTPRIEKRETEINILCENERRAEEPMESKSFEDRVSDTTRQGLLRNSNTPSINNNKILSCSRPTGAMTDGAAPVHPDDNKCLEVVILPSRDREMIQEVRKGDVLYI